MADTTKNPTLTVPVAGREEDLVLPIPPSMEGKLIPQEVSQKQAVSLSNFNDADWAHLSTLIEDDERLPVSSLIGIVVRRAAKRRMVEDDDSALTRLKVVLQQLINAVAKEINKDEEDLSLRAARKEAVEEVKLMLPLMGVLEALAGDVSTISVHKLSGWNDAVSAILRDRGIEPQTLNTGRGSDRSAESGSPGETSSSDDASMANAMAAEFLDD